MGKKFLILIFLINILLFSSGFDKSKEQEIISVVKDMITYINERDAEGYIGVLNDHFIRITYGDKDFIRHNINNFGYIDLVEVKVISIKTYFSVVHYKLIHTKRDNKLTTTFKGKIILDKTRKGWKIHSVSGKKIE